MLTSHVIVRAHEFLVPSVEDRAQTQHLICAQRKIFIVAIIGDHFARYIPPNLCVQLSGPNRELGGIRHDEMSLFLSPFLRNNNTMCFVYQLHLVFSASQQTAADRRVKQQLEFECLFPAMKRKLLHISSLSMEFDAEYGRLLDCNNSNNTQLMLSSLPASLLRLTLSLLSDVDFCARDIATLSSQVPHLRELHLLGGLCLDETAFDELLRPNSPAPFFPSLRCVETTVKGKCFEEILVAASRSALLPQLREFMLSSDLQEEVFEIADVDAASLPLRSLERITRLGNRVLANARFTGAEKLDFASLQYVTSVGDHFLGASIFDCDILDLRDMSSLTSIDSNFFCCGKGVKQVLLPSLRSIGSGMFYACQDIEEIDWCFATASLRCIDARRFAGQTSIRRLETLPLLGKVVGDAGAFCWSCQRLCTIDVSGLAGLTDLGSAFLYKCTALQSVTGMRALARVTHIGREAFAQTFSLSECDVAQMVSVQFIAGSFMFNSAMEETGNILIEAIMKRNIAALGFC